MLDKAWVHIFRVDPAYERGAWNFVRTVAETSGRADMIICPCKDCRNLDRHSPSDVVEHLVIRGMDESYKMRSDWYFHEDTSKVLQWNGQGQRKRQRKRQRGPTKMKDITKDAEVGEKSGPRSVKKRAYPRCVLVDWSSSEEQVAEGRLISSDPEDFVNNNIPLGPHSVKVLVETSLKPETFLWRPAPNMFTIEEALGEMIAWSAKNCLVLDPEATSTDINKCKLMDWIGKEEVVVAEGRWETRELKALVNGIPLGPNAVKVFVEEVLKPDTFLWRPTPDMTTIEESLKSFIAWPANRVVFETNTYEAALNFPIEESTTLSPLPRSRSNNPDKVVKENQKGKLNDCTGKKRIVAKGRFVR